MSPLPSINRAHSTTPLKSALATLQPVLPEICSSTVLPRTQPKKRVRFALQLDSEEDKPITPVNEEKTPTIIVNSNKRSGDPWRSNGPLYGVYTEYLEKKENTTPEIPDVNRPATPQPEPETSTYTHTFLIQSKIPEIVVDSITVSTPTRHLPRIVQRTKATKTTVRKSPSPPSPIDHFLKQRSNAASPPKRMPQSINNRSPTFRRSDLALPVIRSPHPTEKFTRTDPPPLGTKIVNEYLQSKKLTEIIANPLPHSGAHQISYICGHTILPNLSKTSSTSYQNQNNNEPYFFQNYTNDHFQPIIHSSH